VVWKAERLRDSPEDLRVWSAMRILFLVSVLLSLAQSTADSETRSHQHGSSSDSNDAPGLHSSPISLDSLAPLHLRTLRHARESASTSWPVSFPAERRSGQHNVTSDGANVTYIATSAPFTTPNPTGVVTQKPGPYQAGSTELPNLGTVNVLQSVSFQLPSQAWLDEEDVEFVISDGEYAGVGVTIPADAWPASHADQVPSVTLFETSDTMRSALPSGYALRGVSVLYEPDGIPFKKPVRVFVPVSAAVSPAFENIVYKFDLESNTWVPREDTAPPATGASNLLSGQTSSFSAYAAIAVPILQ